jgi:hypothetical protein
VLLSVLIACLTFPDLGSFHESLIIGFPVFRVDDEELNEWLTDLDSTALVYSSSRSSGSDNERAFADYSLGIATKSATAEQTMEHLVEQVRRKAESEAWKCSRSWHPHWFELSKGAAKYALILEDRELTAHDDMFARQGNHVTRLKLYLIGFRAR